eukprot:scaffold107699_cov23-Tisochrysis_lutea.AAC.2
MHWISLHNSVHGREARAALKGAYLWKGRAAQCVDLIRATFLGVCVRRLSAGLCAQPSAWRVHGFMLGVGIRVPGTDGSELSPG